MQIAEKKKKYTVADYMLLEEGAPFQLIDYELIMSPSPTSYHQSISGRLNQMILNYLDSINSDAFVAAAPIDVVFDDGNVFQPDLVYISAERKVGVVKDQIMGAPEMVIEILSPSTGYYDLRDKKEIYEKYGVKEYLIFDPKKESAELYSIVSGVFQLKQKAVKSEKLNSDVIAGFSFDLQKIFK